MAAVPCCRSRWPPPRRAATDRGQSRRETATASPIAAPGHDRIIDVHSYSRHPVRMTDIVATARLRPRNQLTLPDAVVQAAGLDEGATFVVELDPAEPDVVRLRRV